MERYKAVLAWLGMGNKTPSAKLDAMANIIPASYNFDNGLFKTLFLQQLPTDVQEAVSEDCDRRTVRIAKAADWFFTHDGERLYKEPLTVSAARREDSQTSRRSAVDSSKCFYHRMFGKDARKCDSNTARPCSMRGVFSHVCGHVLCGKLHRQSPVAAATGKGSRLLYLQDTTTGAGT
jgi:hypothetical protein